MSLVLTAARIADGFLTISARAIVKTSVPLRWKQGRMTNATDTVAQEEDRPINATHATNADLLPRMEQRS